jgi:hypothetical protein
MAISEEELESAPEEILPAQVARERGFPTYTWPCVEFNFRYIRKGKTNTWTAMPEMRHVAESENGYGNSDSSIVLWRPEVESDKHAVNVRILQEYDPRLRDPRDQPGLLQALTEEARRRADERFKDRHRKAVIERD